VAENPDAIRREIEVTREEMADTIDAMEYKADVKARAADKVTELRESVAERADSVLSSMKGTAQRMTEGMRGGMSDTTSTMQRETGEMTHRARSGMQRGKRMAEGNPLLVAVGAVAAGFLIGAALPGSPMEDQRIGPKSDEVKSQAMRRGSEMVERAGHKAQETVQRTTDQARSRIEETREGSTSGGESTGSPPPTETYGTTR
jgi:cell division septum initiation protein DivIVA